MNMKNIQKNKGFTLVETMFAVFILTFAISSLMSVVASSIFSARYARDEITANYLLQEVIDYVRNDRDSQVFLQTETPGIAWQTFVQRYDLCSDPSEGCYVDVYKNTPLVKCDGGGVSGCPAFYLDQNASGGNFYTYDTTPVTTNFKRQLVVTRNPLNQDEIFVTATIEWKNGGLSKTRELKSSLVKWQP